MALKRINMNLEEDLLENLDKFAESLHINRSAAISVALSQFFMEQKAIGVMDKLTDLMKAGQLSAGATAELP